MNIKLKLDVFEYGGVLNFDTPESQRQPSVGQSCSTPLKNLEDSGIQLHGYLGLLEIMKGQASIRNKRRLDRTV